MNAVLIFTEVLILAQFAVILALIRLVLRVEGKIKSVSEKPDLSMPKPVRHFGGAPFGGRT